MGSIIKRYNALKSRVEVAQRKADKAAGVLEQLQKELRKGFDCPNIKRAKRLLKQLEAQEEREQREYAEKLKEFEDEFGEVLK